MMYLMVDISEKTVIPDEDKLDEGNYKVCEGRSCETKNIQVRSGSMLGVCFCKMRHLL